MMPSEQIPIPCGRCGASMREHGHAALVGPVHVQCPFCGAVEALPAEHAQRVVALRARLAALRAAVEGEEAPAVAFARVMQTLRGQVWVFVAFGVIVVGMTLSSAITPIQRAIELTDLPESARAELLSSATMPAIMIGVLAGAAVAYVLALLKYKKAIEPTLQARPPMAPGLPARCRSCGASLPTQNARAALVPCPHCAATNLLSDELTRDRARLLALEARAYQERAQGVFRRAQRAAVAFQTYLLIGAGVGLSLGLLLSLSLRLVIANLFF